MGRNSNTMLWKRARMAGLDARLSQEKLGVTVDPERGWHEAFLCFAAAEFPGLEAAYRQFAHGFDERNGKWTGGNDD